MSKAQWFIDFLFITRDSRKSNKLCGNRSIENDLELDKAE